MDGYWVRMGRAIHLQRFSFSSESSGHQAFSIILNFSSSSNDSSAWVITVRIDIWYTSSQSRWWIINTASEEWSVVWNNAKFHSTFFDKDFLGEILFQSLWSNTHGTGGHLTSGHRRPMTRHAHSPVWKGEWFAQPWVPLLVVLVEVQSEAEALQRLVVAACQLEKERANHISVRLGNNPQLRLGTP